VKAFVNGKYFKWKEEEPTPDSIAMVVIPAIEISLIFRSINVFVPKLFLFGVNACERSHL